VLVALSLLATAPTAVLEAPASAAPAPPGGAGTVPLIGTEASQPPVAVPPIPAVDPSVTDGQDPHALLARAIALLTAGDQVPASQQPQTLSLSSMQAKVNALSVTAAQAQAAAARAAATAQQAEAAAAAAQVAARQATMQAAADRQSASSLSAGAAALAGDLQRAALDLYMSGGAPRLTLPTAGPDANGDAIVDAMVGEQVALSPDGMLAAERRAAAGAARTAASAQAEMTSSRSQAAGAQQAAVTAANDAATAQAASAKAAQDKAAAAAQLAAIHQQLASAPPAVSQVLQAEATDVAQQAGKDLTSGVSLQFTPAAPLPPPPPTTTVALAWAFSELGKQYVWGGTGPDVFDCSGLTQYSWNKAGQSIPRVAIDQYSYTVPVPLSQLRPGDLVFFGSDVHHVGMYIGDGLMINAPHTGAVVSITPMWWSDLIGFGRVHGPGVAVPAHTPPATPGAVDSGTGTVPSQTSPPPGAAPISGGSSSTTTPPSSPSSSSSTTVPASGGSLPVG
jgi:cell wall-associated NlpC family hydrolase